MEYKELKNPQYHRKRKKRRQKILPVFLQAVTLLLLFSSILFVGSKAIISAITEKGYVFDGAITVDQPPSLPQVNLDNLYSPYAILVDLDSGDVLSRKKSNDRIYPASLTKIMTAILSIENTDDMEQTIQLNADLFQPLYEQNASMAGFQPGEEVRLKDLLYGIMLPSGAECCAAFAEQIAGSESEFVKMMNEKARKLGMHNTHFTNTTGLHHSEHYSTVEDIAILLQYALKNEMFRDAFTSSRYSTQPSDQHPDGFTFRSTMFKYMDSAEVTGGEILGGKTGYTEEAGLCLASLAQINGKEYIFVTAKADGTHETEQFHILDAINVYNQIGEATNDLEQENEKL